ncbi:MAG: right-handed parallel beta-helix repeat-containing protein [Planctomycetes bacterium]|nr:right-handed parallel beta-helix repeat-containing protein [Planctomycetota bacterium]
MNRVRHLGVLAVLAALATALPQAPLAGQGPFELGSADGGTSAYASLPAALDAIAARRAQGDATALVLRIAGGTHVLDAPIVVRPEHTAHGGRLTIESRAGERAVLSGGLRIASWRVGEHAGQRVWIAELGPEHRELRELWIGERRAILARHPDRDTLPVEAVPAADGDWTHGNDGFRFRAGDLDERAIGADLVVMSRWVESHLPVLAVDVGTRLVRCAKRSVFRLDAGDLWYAEGALAHLDQPGEFCVDRKTGTLRYLPLPGEEPATVSAWVPRLVTLLNLDGRPKDGQFVDGLTIRELSFRHAEWWFPAGFRSNWPSPDAGGFSQAAILVPAAIHATGARNCRFEDCEFAQLGGYALELGSGCSGNSISYCVMRDLGAGGIKIGTTAIPDEAHDLSSANTVSDCDIGDGGQIFHSAIGIWIGQSPGNRLLHNAVHDFLYTGISIGWTWGYGPSAARDQRVEGNHVHHIGARRDGTGPWLSDLAGIYTLGVQPGTLIVGNLFHDIAARRYGGWGIYFDEGTSELRAERNVVARTTHGGFHQHYGRDNVFDNNVLIDGRDAQVQRTRVEEHRSFTFTRNLVVWQQGPLFAGDLSDLRCAFDRNLYWCREPAGIRFGKLDFAAWQAAGMDGGSRIVDPGMVDAATADHRLRDDSPARALGIESIDLRGVGPRARTSK